MLGEEGEEVAGGDGERADLLERDDRGRAGALVDRGELPEKVSCRSEAEDDVAALVRRPGELHTPVEHHHDAVPEMALGHERGAAQERLLAADRAQGDELVGFEVAEEPGGAARRIGHARANLPRAAGVTPVR